MLHPLQFSEPANLPSYLALRVTNYQHTSSLVWAVAAQSSAAPKRRAAGCRSLKTRRRSASCASASGGHQSCSTLRASSMSSPRRLGTGRVEKVARGWKCRRSGLMDRSSWSVTRTGMRELGTRIRLDPRTRCSKSWMRILRVSKEEGRPSYKEMARGRATRASPLLFQTWLEMLRRVGILLEMDSQRRG